jgi:poly(hydroxyalkanoate) depolymerase family esterase
MQWSRDMRIARRSVRTALRAASAMARAQSNSLRRSPGVAEESKAVSQLVEQPEFGSNPGRLAMYVYQPARPIPAGAPLIVLLHGCGQTAASFARDAGWIDLAEELGIPLVLPEQAGSNNHGRCFNWFNPAQTARDRGESLSIRQMVSVAAAQFRSDPARVFVAGLSAGGAMTAALLAAWPDVFSAGAIVAGLPVGAASSTAEALVRMAEAGPRRSRQDWARQVHAAAPDGFAGPWPRVTIWHGLADQVVDSANARLLAEQWSAVHAIDAGAASVLADGSPTTVWGQHEHPSVELHLRSGLAHLWPVEATADIARFWGLRPD